jgi:hypothetical protein
MVQDSWAKPHTERGSDNKILGFQDYLKQSASEHKEGESVKGLDEESWKDVQKIPGAEAALAVSKKLIDAFLNKDKEAFMKVVEENYILAEGAYVGRSARGAPWTTPELTPEALEQDRKRREIVLEQYRERWERQYHSIR